MQAVARIENFRDGSSHDGSLTVYEEIVVQAIPSHFLETEACDMAYSLHFLPFSEQFLQCHDAEEVNTC